MHRFVVGLRIRRRKTICSLLLVSILVFSLTIWLRSFYEHSLLTAEIINLASVRKLITFFRSERWGLGNEMFAFASTMCIAKRYPNVWTVCLQPHALIRRAFDLRHVPNCDANILLNRLHATMFTEFSYAAYDPRVETLQTNTHLVLNKFFQSWKYFSDCGWDIRQLFRFESSMQSRARQILADSVHEVLRCSTCIEDTSLIGVHVRRGNMANAADLVDIGYTVADSKYIDRAIKYIQNNVSSEYRYPRRRFVIVVISDDITWCRDALSHRDNVVYVSTGDAILDMAVLSQCKDIVITVGSFGWWTAWLAAKRTVVYYNDWPRKGSLLDRTTSRFDYFPPGWIPL